jgi:hypothetical protein
LIALTDAEPALSKRAAGTCGSDAAACRRVRERESGGRRLRKLPCANNHGQRKINKLLMSSLRFGFGIEVSHDKRKLKKGGPRKAMARHRAAPRKPPDENCKLLPEMLPKGRFS